MSFYIFNLTVSEKTVKGRYMNILSTFQDICNRVKLHKMCTEEQMGLPVNKI